MQWSDRYRARVVSNIGILTEAEQERLRRACVGVAGCGGIGGHAAADLAYWGVGRIKLADLDRFEASNANRQQFAGESTIGRDKLTVVAERLLDIDPEIRIDRYARGITLKNAEAFASGCDLVLDAIDYESPRYSLALHRGARRQGIPVYVSQGIGLGASMFAFFPGDEPYERLLGIDPVTDLEELKVGDVDLSALCPIAPDYIDRDLWQQVLAGQVEAPVAIAGQSIAVALTVTEMVLQIAKPGQRRPLRMCAYDAFHGRFIKSYESPVARNAGDVA